MTDQIKPRKLKAGARIGVVNPSYWLEEERLQRAIKVFENLGYEVVLGKSTCLQENQCAGSPWERAEDIMAMFEDNSIEAIICARGGYGGNRVLPLLDYDVIRANPKIFVGYSDITGLLSSISQQSGLITFHGPMLSTYGKKTVQYNLDVFQRVLSGQDNVKIESIAECRARCLKPGIASGPLWGGNLTLVMERLATNDQIDTAGSVLLIEDIDEKLYAFERMMLHLRASGSLDRIKGLIVGEMLEMGDSSTPFGKTTDEIVLDVCGDLNIPIISNFPCGHGDYQATLPISHQVEIHADEKNPHILISESPVY
ncbi:MAG: LD-carboxypeptidase [Xanthomonadales bacterium]|nr:LD-carboxypeptidase [Xanthomonadales bacterium]